MALNGEAKPFELPSQDFYHAFKQAATSTKTEKNEESESHLTNDKCDEESGNFKFFPSLTTQRRVFLRNMLNYMKISGEISSVLDLGVGKGDTLAFLRNDRYKHLIGIDREVEALEFAENTCQPILYQMMNPLYPKLNVHLVQSDFIELVKSLESQKAATTVQTQEDVAGLAQNSATCFADELALVSSEVIEHIPLEDVKHYELFIFKYIQPRYVIITTPNSEFNIWFLSNDPTKEREGEALRKQLTAFKRHPDHKFEWNQKEFEEWAKQITHQFPNYEIFQNQMFGVGKGREDSTEFGYASQAVIFKKKEHLFYPQISWSQFRRQLDSAFLGEGTISSTNFKLFKKIEYPVDDDLADICQFVIKRMVSKMKDMLKWRTCESSQSDEETDNSSAQQDTNTGSSPSNWIEASQLMNFLDHTTCESFLESFTEDYRQFFLIDSGLDQVLKQPNSSETPFTFGISNENLRGSFETNCLIKALQQASEFFDISGTMVKLKDSLLQLALQEGEEDESSSNDELEEHDDHNYSREGDGMQWEQLAEVEPRISETTEIPFFETGTEECSDYWEV